MSGQNTVGFGFQADIVNTASLGHLITGRILKAMSDGNIDFYAVAAAIALGKSIPVQRSLESTVHKHIAPRGSLRSVFNNILSMGWGHSEVAIEMSRTRAGTNALLLIGAIATGGWTHFQAAQCLSELLSLNGCEADRLPNVDVLKGLVEYLAPFTFDLGFSKVLEHITTAVKCANRDRGPSANNTSYKQSIQLGNAPMLAGAIKQLILTAERGERIYMILNKHVSWLPAFASHILGMEVTLQYAGDLGQENSGRTDGGSVIWACAGDQGSVVFELGDRNSRPVSLYRTTGRGIEIVDCQGVHGRLQVDYPLQDAIKVQMAPLPELGDVFSGGICKAIARLSWFLLRHLRLTRPGEYSQGSRINGNFDSLVALKETLGSMGIPKPFQSVLGLSSSDDHFPAYKNVRFMALEWLDEEHFDVLTSLCPRGHCQRHKMSIDCLCLIASRTIFNSATSAVVLMQCRFDASQLRVNLGASVTSQWAQHCKLLMSGGYRNAMDIRRSKIEDSHVLSHLHHLLSPTEGIELETGTLGFSVGAYTVFYTGIMQHDSYDTLGRTITITPGRASVNGCLRNRLCEIGTLCKQPTSSQDGAPSTLATGYYVEPHCQPSDTHVFLDASLQEDHILLEFTTGRAALQATQVNMLHGIDSLLTHWMIPKCPHDKGTPVKVVKDMDMKLVGFSQVDADIINSDGLVLVALQGDKLRQLLTCGFYSEEPGTTKILQFSACLKCCIKIARNKRRPSCIIIGG